MPGRYSTVTVVGPQATRDLALPDDLPVAELLPQMLHYTGAGSGDEPVGWALATADGAALDGADTLGDKDIGDGSVLLIRDATAEALPGTVEDVRDGIEDAVDQTGVRWEAGTGRLLAIATAALLIAAAAFAPGSAVAVVFTGTLVCVLSVLMSWWSARQHPLLTHLALIGGLLWAGRIGYAATAMLAPGAAPATRMVGALAAALAVCLVARAGARLAGAYALAAGTAAVLGAAGWALWAHTGLTAAGAAVCCALAALFAIALAPRAAMFASGLFGLDRDVRAGQNLTDAGLRERLSATDARLTGAVVGLAAAAAAASAVLAATPDRWAQATGAGVALALLTRSRIFELVRHVAPLRLCGMAATAWAAWVWIGHSAPLSAWLPALAVLAALAYVSVASIARSAVSAAWWRRVVAVAEIILVAAIVVGAGQLLGLYAMVAGA